MISDVLSHSAPCILRQYEFATLSSIKLVIFRVQLCFFLPYWASNGPLYNVTTARASVSVCGENVIRIKQLRMASFPLSMPTRNNAKYVIPTCCARICRRSLDFSRICFSLSPISFSLSFSFLFTSEIRHVELCNQSLCNQAFTGGNLASRPTCSFLNFYSFRTGGISCVRSWLIIPSDSDQV